MTLFCKPVCWLYGLKIRHIDEKVRLIHDQYRLSEVALRWRDNRAAQASMCRSTEKMPDHPTLSNEQLMELERLCRMSAEQLRKKQDGLTAQHRRLQDRRAKITSWQRSHGEVPVSQFVSVL